MAVTIGALVGLVLGAALLGALFAWLLRRIVSIAIRPAYAIGVAIATILYLTFSEGIFVDFGLVGGLVVGVLCGLAAFAILVATSRSARRG